MNCFQGATRHCYFDGCVSDSRYGPKVNFISFPKGCLAVRKNRVPADKNHLESCVICRKCQKWLQICKRSIRKVIMDVNKNTSICCNHFVDEAGPTDMYPEPFSAAKALKIRGSPRNRLRKRQAESSIESFTITDKATKKRKRQCVASTSTRVGNGLEEVNVVNQPSDAASKQLVEVLEQYSGHPEDLLNEVEITTKLSLHRDSSCQTDSSSTKTVGTQSTFSFKHVETLRDEVASLKKTIKLLERKIKDMEKNAQLKNKAQKVTGFVESLKMDDKKCKFYTNLFFRQIWVLFTFLQPVDNLRYWNTKKTKSPNKKRLLTPLEELIVTLVRLRTGLLLDDISYRFDISKSFISSVVITWVQHCYYKFDSIRPQMFASREKVKENLPAVFKRLTNIRVILDCAEFFCQVPANYEQQGNLYSSYKAHTTFKVLIGCTPNGGVSFVSDLFEGSISDKEIVKQSKLLNYLEPGDLVLADRGFDIKDQTDPLRVKLNIPPFLMGRNKLTAEEEIETKNIARERIYVEHVVGRLKQFRLLKKILPLNMRGILTQMVFVCACLLNFQNPILEPQAT